MACSGFGVCGAGRGHLSGQLCALRPPGDAAPCLPPGSCGEEAPAWREAADPRENRPGTAPAGVWERGPGSLGSVGAHRYPGCASLSAPGSVPAFAPVPASNAGGLQGPERLCDSPWRAAGAGCSASGGCGAAGPVLTVLCLQAAPGPAPRLSPSEEAQRRLERIFTAAVMPGTLALTCRSPGDGDGWAARGRPGRAVCSTRGGGTPVPGHQPRGPSWSGTGRGGRMIEAAGGFGVAAGTSVPGRGEL